MTINPYLNPPQTPPPFEPPKAKHTGRNVTLLLLGAVIVATIVIVAIAVSQGTATKTPALPYVAPTAAPTTSETIDPAVRDSAYVSTLNSDGITQDSDTLISLGHSECASLDGGATPLQEVSASMTNGFTPHQAGTILGAAVVAYCPAHQGELDAFVQTYGAK